jgi:LuxR family maltose regulon positive regulatory protein
MSPMPGSTTARYAIPHQRRATVERRRLLDRLHGAIGSGVIVVQAPAGFGKTTLLAGFVSELEYNVCWLALDSSSRAADVFAWQLARSISGHDDVARPATSEKLDDLRAYLGAALRQAEARSELPLLVVIDNCHELADADDASELLGWLLDVLAEEGELILSGRALPPIIELNRRIATGECLLLDGASLAFECDEVTALIPPGRALDAAQILRSTDGWPAGVLAMITGAVAGPAAGRTGAAWSDYLAAEVWDGVPEARKANLLSLAVPTAVDSSIAEALIGSADWDAVSRWLTHNDFLTEPFDGGIRINPLFRDFLRAAYRRLDPAGFQADGETVVHHLEMAGQLPEAIEICRDAGLHETLAWLVTRHCRELLALGQYALLRRGFDGLPEELVARNPALRAMRARALAHGGRPAEALGEADDMLSDPSLPGTARTHAMLARHRALRLLGRGAELGQLFEEFRSLPDCGDPTLRAEVQYHEAQWVLPASSDFITAERLLRESLESCAEAGAPTLELLARSTLGQLLAMKGDCPAAVTELTRAALGWRNRGGTSNLGWVLNNLGMAHISVGDFDSAVQTLEEAMREAKACENQRNLAYATASLGDAEIARGNYDAARVHFEEAIRICAEEVLDETLASLSIAGFAAALLGAGDVQQADYFSERAFYIAESVGTPFELASCLLTQAAVHSCSQDHGGAIQSSRRAIEIFREIGAEAPQRMAWYRLALCYFHAGERTEAQDALATLGPLLTETWMHGALIPLIREDPMFAQWAASRGVLGPAFRELLERQTFGGQAADDAARSASRYPRVTAQSLGTVRVAVGGRDVSDEMWASVKSKELFFLFLANRDGLRKEEAVEHLYPEIDRGKCNSAFHSNLYRIRRALYQDSIVKRDGAYMLNPEGEFDWDLERFERTLAEAARLPAGSDERAALYRSALEMYRGPFAEAFYSEWAESLRRKTETRAAEALSTLAGYHAGRGDWDSAARCMELLLERNTENEEAAYQLAAFRARGGHPVAALSFLDQYSRALEVDFGINLPPRFQELRQRIASGQAV